jgi:hypothetical protein
MGLLAMCGDDDPLWLALLRPGGRHTLAVTLNWNRKKKSVFNPLIRTQENKSKTKCKYEINLIKQPSYKKPALTVYNKQYMII